MHGANIGPRGLGVVPSSSNELSDVKSLGKGPRMVKKGSRGGGAESIGVVIVQLLRTNRGGRAESAHGNVA